MTKPLKKVYIFPKSTYNYITQINQIDVQYRYNKKTMFFTEKSIMLEQVFTAALQILHYDYITLKTFPKYSCKLDVFFTKKHDSTALGISEN